MDAKSLHFLAKFFESFGAEVAQLTAEKVGELIPQAQGERSQNLMDATEICQYLGISVSHFYKVKKKHGKKFPTVNIDGAIRFNPLHVEEYFSNHNNKDTNG
ncbi:hypothetical protein [Aegicerativicinus sediminis]|uniref:hypothetical protein n=1 Tax=Aegicerativicinus sediminis TaxID=2893202 RepID=UPI001E40D9AE|nr:hypothetical protein [Aegicerativicinus sediminis]